MGSRGRSELPRWAVPPLTQAVSAAIGVLTLPGVDASVAMAGRLGETITRLRAFGMPKRVRGARERIAFAFPEWSEEQVAACAEGVWRYSARLFFEIARSHRLMNEGAWFRHQTFESRFPGLDDILDGRPAITITAHLGNFELVSHAFANLGIPAVSVYRPLDFEPMDVWMREMRARRGVQLIDKFGAMRQLRKIVRGGQIPAIVADQNAGERGEFVPFFGRLASSYKSVATMLIRTQATAVVGAVLREGGAHGLGIDEVHDGATGRRFDELGYRVNMTSAIRYEDWKDQPDPAFYITARYRHELEQLIRMAPDQYFWMHRCWKSRPAWERERTGFPQELREKLEALPWMTADDVEAIVEQSDRDAAELERRGTDRLN